MRNVNQSGLAPQGCGVTLLANQTQEKQSKRVLAELYVIIVGGEAASLPPQTGIAFSSDQTHN